MKIKRIHNIPRFLKENEIVKPVPYMIAGDDAFPLKKIFDETIPKPKS